MPSLRHIFVTLCLCLPPLVGPAPAQHQSDLLPLFARCSGRLSAFMEFQWLMQDPGSDVTRQQRDAMTDLLEAVVQPDTAVQAMDLRLHAKVALADMLNRTAFDPAHADWARQRAVALLAECTSVLLS